MRKKNVVKEGSEKLLVFFAGWGASAELFDGIEVEKGWDFIICFDYSDGDFSFGEVADYNFVRVIAWSLGVMVAELAMGNSVWKVVDAVAINGTRFPVNDAFGIPERVFRLTLDGMKGEGVWDKFKRRMCLDKLSVFEILNVERERDILQCELKYLYDCALHNKVSGICIWKKAIVGRKDLIFPYENQIAAWKQEGSVRIEERDVAHYDEALWISL